MDEDQTMVCLDDYKIKECRFEEIEGECHYINEDDVVKVGICLPAVLSDKISWRYEMPRVIYHCIDYRF